MTESRPYIPLTEDVVVGPDEIEPPIAPDPALEFTPTPVVAPDGPKDLPPTPSADLPRAARAKPERSTNIAKLRRERRDLFDERELAVYHVGGLAVELRRRGRDDLGLVNRRAERIIELDRKLADLDQRLEDLNDRRRRRAAPTAGYCLSCGAPYQVEATFCFRCGARVIPPDAPDEGSTGDSPTTVIDVPAGDQ